MNKIEFNYSPNIFLSSGIVSLKHYLEDFKDKTDIQFSFILSDDKLIIESERLLELLEAVYYYMGKEIYDTSGQKALDKSDKYYFTKEPFQGIPFPKMFTYGVAGLITNNASAVESKDGKKIKFEKLYKEDPEFAKKIGEFLNSKGKKIKFFSFVNNTLIENSIDNNTGKKKENKGGESEIFIDAPYTKTTKLEIDADFLSEGNNICYLTGESYKKLSDTNCVSPFFAGMNNFNSFLSKSDKKISWKALYLARFSPKVSFYHYSGAQENISVFFFNSNNLKNLEKLYQNNSSLYKNSIELISSNYISNFKSYNFDSEKELSKDFTEKNEFLFLLIFSFYKRFLISNQININNQTLEWDPFAESEFKVIPISLSYFKSDKFASTMRPDSFEEINHFKFLIRLFAFMEKNEISFRELLSSLKIIKPSEKGSKNKYRLERQLRNNVLGKILKLKSILNEIEDLFYRSFLYQIAGDTVGYKNFNQIFNFLSLYEKIIHYGGNKEMNPELQEKSINLGISIGQGILRFENPDDKNFQQKQSNVKSGRVYIISLKKARTMKQFLDEIIRIMTKFNISISKDILNQINDKNFIAIKQFAIISALNQLNTSINFKKEEKINEPK